MNYRNDELNVILSAVSEEFNVPIKDIRGRSQKRSFCDPRHVSMYLCRTVMVPRPSLSQIGEWLGGVGHQPVINAIKKVEFMMIESRVFSTMIERLSAECCNELYGTSYLSRFSVNELVREIRKRGFSVAVEQSLGAPDPDVPAVIVGEL